jgi:bifunctional DNA-binding transcriptional regulator/antitoxin component of YhaV-PrlF toxin-antitoxin module
MIGWGSMSKKHSLKPTRTHKLTISGGKNYSLVLPIEFIRELGWRERQKLNITLDKKRLIIEDWEQ